MKKRPKPDSRLQVLREAVIRDGLAASSRRAEELSWLHERGYFETFTDVNGTACYRVTDKALEALERGRLEEG